jgi:choline kinase
LRAIILAAGKGSRLEPVSGETVKCLVDLGGITLIERQLGYLRASGTTEIAIVVGFQAERIRGVCGPEIDYIENPIFAETNSMYSLWLARRFFADGFLVLNSDVLFHPQLLVDLLTAKYDDAILISYRHQAKYGDEEMKVKVRGGQLLDISKSMDPGECDGENVGMVKFGAAGATVLGKALETLVSKGEVRSWAPRAFLEFTKTRALHVVDTRGYPWTEIDFPEDLQRACEEVLPQIPELPFLRSVAAASEER